jgi:lipoate-protein ligase A
MKQILYKVPNGKLLRIFIDKDDQKIIDVKITGDFFVYPEEKISLIEDVIRGKSLDKEQLMKDIDEVVAKESIELFGVNAEGIVTALFL